MRKIKWNPMIVVYLFITMLTAFFSLGLGDSLYLPQAERNNPLFMINIMVMGILFLMNLFLEIGFKNKNIRILQYSFRALFCIGLAALMFYRLRNFNANDTHIRIQRILGFVFVLLASILPIVELFFEKEAESDRKFYFSQAGLACAYAGGIELVLAFSNQQTSLSTTLVPWLNVLFYLMLVFAVFYLVCSFRVFFPKQMFALNMAIQGISFVIATVVMIIAIYEEGMEGITFQVSLVTVLIGLLGLLAYLAGIVWCFFRSNGNSKPQDRK